MGIADAQKVFEGKKVISPEDDKAMQAVA